MKSEDLRAIPDRVKFTKLSASGNDFIVLDNREDHFTAFASDLARRICARRYSIGADGMILFENSRNASFRIRFFNPDGNEFSTCGNGGRCAARHASLFLLRESQFSLETSIGVIDAIITPSGVKLKFVEPQEIRLNVSLRLNGKTITGNYVKLGDPHFVTPAENIRALDFVTKARPIRHHESLGAEGANVHFIERISSQKIAIRSFERGVEDETLACGSGCISAAVSTFLNHESEPPVTFIPQSGIPLCVHFSPQNQFKDLYLEGDARLIYAGEFTKEALIGFP